MVAELGARLRLSRASVGGGPGMLRAMQRSWLAALFLLGCPADDGSSASGTAGPMTTDPATSTGSSDGTQTSVGPETTEPATGADSSTGPAECEPGREPAGFTVVEGCADVIGEPFCSEGQEHVPQDSEVAWMSDPPHSGPHYPTWELWGEHDVTVPRGNWVHNLEHGGIVLSYRCADPCEAELGILRDVVEQRPELRILLTPDPFLPGSERFAAISWTWVHRFDAPALDELLCFADQHENHAPEDVP